MALIRRLSPFLCLAYINMGGGSMQLVIRGHHLTITPAIEAKIKTQFDKITKHLDQVISIQVILEKDHRPKALTHKGEDNHIAEVILRLPGKEFFAQAAADDMYTAINILTEKLKRQIERYKSVKKAA